MIKKVEKSIHQPVLLNETIENLNLSEKSIVIDATYGGGGHSKEILKRFPKIKIIALDQDESVAKDLDKKISFYPLNFRNLDEVAQKAEVNEKVDAIIFDLGLSSDQLENSGRGFSFMKDEPLLMTMKNSVCTGGNPSPEDLTAMDIVNSWSEESLADIIYGYGEERFSRKIARGIVQARAENKIKTTFDLVKIIQNNVPTGYQRGRLHYATRTFQALRIAVNDELNTLQIGLEKGFKILKKEGIMSVISFHSLEDRIVKKFFREKKEKNEAILINKKPITPTGKEIKENPRSRSAKLRILKKT